MRQKFLHVVPYLTAQIFMTHKHDMRKPHAHMTSICFSIPGSETLPILLKFSLFSAQISGFSAVFHRKSLDIVKQHTNNAKILADSVSIFQ